MHILFIGPDSGTSLHRYRGFQRLGHNVRLIDPRRLLPRHSIVDKIEWKLHPGPLATWVQKCLQSQLEGDHFDLAFVDGGSLVSAKLVRYLKRRCARVVNYNVDDPFGRRDGVRFAVYREAAAQYDLLVVVRRENVAEAQALGAKRVVHAFRVADEVAHSPRIITDDILARWKSDVAFVGTWMPERGPFLLALLEQSIPLAIYGARWEKSPEWPKLKRAWRTTHLEGDEYCYAIQCAKINIGLLSVGNRDLHTQRSLEIPSLNSVLCAQRTREHQELYQEGEEAIFWDDARECARLSFELLSDDQKRAAIARNGRNRALRNGHFTELLLNRIIKETFNVSTPPVTITPTR